MLMLKDARVLAYMKDQFFLLTHYRQKIYRLRGLLYHQKQQFHKAAELYYSCLTYGVVYRKGHQLKCLRDLMKTIENLKNDQSMKSITRRNQLIQELETIIHFIENKKRDILILLDYSTKALPYLQKIKPIFQSVLSNILTKKDQLSFGGFSDRFIVLHPFEEASFDFEELKQILSDTLIRIRRISNGDFRDYYTSLNLALKYLLNLQEEKPEMAIKHFLAGGLEKNRRDNDSETSQKLSIESGSEIMNSSRVRSQKEGVKHLVMCVFGAYNPANNDIEPVTPTPSSPFRRPDLGFGFLRDKTKLRDLDEIQDTLNENYYNICVVVNDIEVIKKEKLFKIIHLAKRSVIIDLSDPNNTPSEIEEILTQFLT